MGDTKQANSACLQWHLAETLETRFPGGNWDEKVKGARGGVKSCFPVYPAR